MAQQNVKLQLLSIVAILIRDTLTLPIESLPPGTEIPIGGEDIGKIVNIHNDFRARENPFGNAQLIVSHLPICIIAKNG